MLDIAKNNEPSCLARFKLENQNTREISFQDLPSGVKKKIKNTLLAEQGFLCCYCMRRITYETMRVEHWKSQRDNKDLRLTYSNMLAACDGGEGKNVPDTYTHCDVHKRHRDLSYNPSNPGHHVEDKVKYQHDGTIIADDKYLLYDIETILNLNSEQAASRLILNRKAIKKSLDVLFTKDTITLRDIARLITKFSSKNSAGKFEEYAGVTLYYLKKRKKTLATHA